MAIIRTPTTGQQLIDIKQVYDAGALSREEYERTRRALIDSHPPK